MNRDLEDQLRLTLQDRAANVDGTRDLSRSAIDKSRVIRRNRTRLTVASSVAAVAVVVPAVLFTGDRLSGTENPVAPPSSVSPTVTPTPTPLPTTPGASSSVPPVNPASPATSTTKSGSPDAQTPTKVTLDLGELPRGEAPRTVYLDGRTVIAPAGRVRVPGTGTIGRTIQADGRVFALTYPADGSADSTMFELPLGGGAGTQVRDVTGLRASADGEAGAYTITRQNSDGSPIKGSTLHHRRGGTRSELALPAAYGVDLHAVTDDAVYFSTLNSRRERGVLQRWTIGERTADTLSRLRRPIFVDAGRDVAGVLLDSIGDYYCTGLVELSSGQRRWRSCDYSVRGPVGDAVLVTAARSDGWANPLFGVVDARTGALLHEWRVWNLAIEVETDDSVLAEVEQDGEHALIRCTVSTGKCELATPLADGAGPDEPRRYNLGS